MKAKKENYQPFVIAGLILTLLMTLAFSIYWLGESTRLAKARESNIGERISSGREIYAQQCVACHGAQGEGGAGPALNNAILLKNAMDDQLFSIVRSGVPNTQMPAWSVDFGGPLTDEDIRDVVSFVRGWEATAPEVKPVALEPDAERGALLFASTCALCHGENGLGNDKAPVLNNRGRLNALDDDWYRATIKNGRPAKGMPTWGTVLSPNQIEDLIAMIDVWRKGQAVKIPFSVTDQIASAAFSIQEKDLDSAMLQINRALGVTEGPGAEILRNARAQLEAGDAAGALVTLEALARQWPIGDPTLGAEIYDRSCKPCHGVSGEGGIGKALKSNEYIQTSTNAVLVKFILEGRIGTAMAGFKGRLTEKETADVITFLRTWQPQP